MQTFKLSGLTCAACQKLITKRIIKIVGVKDVIVELGGKTEINSERNIEKAEIQKVLEGTEYKVV